MVLKLKDEFPLTKGKIYFDTAVMGACPASTLAVMEEYVRDMTDQFRGEGDWRSGTERWTERRINSKRLFAEFIGASVEEVCFVPNASTGINTALSMLPFRRGTNIVTTNLAFPMCAVAALKQRERGAKVKFIRNRRGVVTPEQFEKAVNDKTVAVMVDQPSWFNGFLLDLKAISEICRRHGAKLVVDATQSVGSLVWDAPRWGVDFLTVSTYKWLLGGPYNQSAGFLYIAKRLMDEYQPAYVGGQTVTPEESRVNTEDAFTLYDYKPREGLGRLEIYPRSEAAYVAVENSMRVLLSHGRRGVERQVRDVDNRLVELLTKHRFSLQTPKEEEKRIYLNVKVPDFKAVGERLYKRGVVVSPRIGGLRISPHLYNTEEEAEAFVKALRDVAKPR
jgi:selenocysteine lyase/cysteine desulfurase